MSFTILTDTSANLPTPILRKNEIEVIPFYYYIEDHPCACLDTEAFDGKAYYDRIRRGENISTSQITPQRYLDVFEPLLKEGKDLLFIGMSSGISGSYASSEMAAKELLPQYPGRKIRLVDTIGASLGEGLLVLRAVEMRREGFSLELTAQELLKLRDRMCQVFTVDDLMHLKKTGRLSGTAALFGTVLQIKPLLKGNEIGQIVTYGKVRGRKKAIEALAEKYAKFVYNARNQTVGIAHADCEEDAKYLAKLLREADRPKEILTVCYEPVTGSHVGPGTLALFFESREGVRST